MAIPKYLLRVARVPIALEILSASDGEPMRMDDLVQALSAEVGEEVQADELRADLLSYFCADAMPLGITRDSVLEFLGPEGVDAEPEEAEWLRVSHPGRLDELGVEYVDAEEFAMLYMAAQALAEAEPDNQPLQEAIGVLVDSVFGEATLVPAAGATWVDQVASLREAAEQHRKVRIVYSRMWSEGIGERVIDPYRLIQTRGGWEVDAGPLDEDGKMRTFLLSHIRELEVLDEEFESPADLSERLRAQRATARVRIQIPPAASWAADFYGSHVEQVDDGDMLTLDVDLLPPLEDRLGLLLLVAGEDARVIHPAGLVQHGPAMAARLLAHHRSTDPAEGRK